MDTETIDALVAMARELCLDGEGNTEYVRGLSELLATAAGLEMNGGREAMAARILGA